MATRKSSNNDSAENQKVSENPAKHPPIVNSDDPVKKTVGKRKNLFDGTPGPGRPKGVPNKMTTAAKDAIAIAAERLGGADRLVSWAKEDPLNERAFWSSIYPKLLPLQVTGEGGGPLKTIARIELVAMTGK